MESRKRTPATLVNRVPVSGVTWSNPAFADGKLFLREDLGRKTTGSQLMWVDLLRH